MIYAERGLQRKAKKSIPNAAHSNNDLRGYVAVSMLQATRRGESALITDLLAPADLENSELLPVIENQVAQKRELPSNRSPPRR